MSGKCLYCGEMIYCGGDDKPADKFHFSPGGDNNIQCLRYQLATAKEEISFANTKYEAICQVLPPHLRDECIALHIKYFIEENARLRGACENLVRGQLQHPTFKGYVDHAVWCVKRALEGKNIEPETAEQAKGFIKPRMDVSGGWTGDLTAEQILADVDAVDIEQPGAGKEGA